MNTHTVYLLYIINIQLQTIPFSVFYMKEFIFMEKQTVEQLYHEQQQLNQQNQASGQPASVGPMGYLEKTAQAIQQSQQAIRQVQVGQYQQLQLAEQRLQHALLQLQQFKTKGTKMAEKLPESVNQQLEQAYHEINQAGQTLALVRRQLSNS